MKVFSSILTVTALASCTSAFTSVAFRPMACTAHSMVESSRRSAIATGIASAGSLLFLPAAAMALVDMDEDSAAMVRRIAANSEAANAAAKAKKIKEEEDAKNNAGAGQNLVAAGLVGSVALSLPFFLPNLIRLGQKLGSGGENDGYGSVNKKK